MSCPNSEEKPSSIPNKDYLQQLVNQACCQPPQSLQRRKYLNRLIAAITKAGKLWHEQTDYYEDALQQTWIYLCRNLCEAVTAKQPYNPQKSLVTTWLDRYLKRRLQDFYLQAQAEKEKRVLPSAAKEGNFYDPVQNIPAPPATQDIQEETRHWVQSDPEGELRSIHVKGRKDITCQLIILRRLPPETSWQQLGAEWDCSYSTLANFYQRKCLPKLRKFARHQGYL